MDNYLTPLETVNMSELFDKAYLPKPTIIEGMLYAGTYLFAGAPKLGKSYFMLQLAYHVSMGKDLWGCKVNPGAVLYLALEDDFRRLQDRLYRMFGTESAANLFMATSSNQLGYGLLEQIQVFLNDHPAVSLVIVDTLQMVRQEDSDKYSYSKDYDVIKAMKEFSDANRICLMLVHHTRKQQADDKFEMISGTNGLMGAADAAFLMHKEKRSSASAVLDISGRDQPDQRIYLTRNLETLAWELDRVEANCYAPKPEPVLEAISEFITSKHQDWSGTATELIEELKLDIKPNALSAKLNINASRLLKEYNIYYATSRTNSSRKIELHLMTEILG